MTEAAGSEGTEPRDAEIARLRAENARLRQALSRATAGAASGRLAELVETSRQGVVVHRGGPPLYCNPRLAEMLGMTSPEEFMRCGDALSHVHPDDLPHVAADVALYLSGRKPPADGEFRLVRADGAVLWVEGSSSTVDWDGAPAIATAMLDIADRKAAERELRRSRRLFQTAFDASPAVMTLTELESGRFVDVNRTFLALSGYAREEVIGRTAAELRILDAEAEAGLAAALKGQAQIRDLELRGRDRQGEIRSYLLSGEVLRFPDQNLVLIVASDITERRRQLEELSRSREQAEAANRAKSAFLASVSHELRTPLNAIIGFAEIMRDQMFGPLGSPRYASYAADIHLSGQHLLGIINDLLDLSKLEAGRMEMREAVLSPADAIADSFRLLEGRAQAGRVQFAAEVPQAPPPLCADPRLLRQILINLLSNAVTWTPPGGRVTAAFRLRSDGRAEFRVSDTGPGMDAAEIAIALTPFGRVDRPSRPRHDGSGLGLPLARQLARLHGGELDIASRPGQGTQVTVLLPADRVLDRGR